ncbi:MAG: hypothetical protein LBM27_03615 [Lactobacillaceae bacterium]|jgi:YbbR domain-containing protein|nr:hypothetical protein [Lactobacillaceae bacterium]
MDNIKKFFSGRWFRMAVSLVFTLIIFSYVNGTFSGNGANRATDQQLVATDSTTISVPLTVKYDDSKYYVTGAPETVKVKISGPSSLVLQASKSSVISATVDLTNPKVGSQEAKITFSGFASSITADPSRKYITVNVIEKASKKVDIESSYNQDNISDDYNVESFKLSDNTATVTGAKDLVETVDHLVAVPDIPNDLSADYAEVVTLKAVDKNGAEVNVDINPESVTATLKLEKKVDDDSSETQTKSISVNPAYTGSVSPNDYSIRMSTSSIQVTGPKSVLDTLNSITLNIDLDTFSSDGGSRTFSVTKPDGVTSITPENIEVTIKPKTSDSSSSDSSSASESDSSSESSN